jgi:magnesium transporter
MQSEKMTTWEAIRQLLDEGDAEVLGAFVDSLAASDLLRALARLSGEDQERLLRELPAETAADLIEELPDLQAAELIDGLPADEAASIIAELPSHEQADVLAALTDDEADAILEFLDPDEAERARQLISYEPDSAGGLMMGEFVALTPGATIADAIDAVMGRRTDYALYNVQYLYVVTRYRRRLLGVARFRDVILAAADATVRTLMKPAQSIRVETPLAELSDVFDATELPALPVVDENDVLVGVLRREAVMDALNEKATVEHLKSQGIIGGEELRSMPIFTRARRRLAWLTVNIGLNIVAASVIASFEETLSAVIALAVFLPIVSDMSGCSGNQAVAVSMRELTLGVIKPVDAFRVWWLEASVGLMNGLVLGLLLGGAAWAWKGNVYLGMVVGGALAANTLLAVSIGGTVPLLLSRFGVDPAVASGPVLTTVTDMCGFFLVLSLAASVLPLLS